MDRKHKIWVSIILIAALAYITYLVYDKENPAKFSFFLTLIGTVLGFLLTALFEKKYYIEIADKIIENLKYHLYSPFSKIFPIRENSEKKQFLSEPGETLIYICISGKKLIDDFKEEIKEALETKEITIYLLDPNGNSAQKREEELLNEIESNNLRREICNSIKDFAEYTIKNIKNTNKTFKIYKYDAIPYFSAIILENKNIKEYYITHHLFYKRTKKCPFFYIRKINKDFYKIYGNVIDKFIENNKDIIFDNKENSNKAEDICNGTTDIYNGNKYG